MRTTVSFKILEEVEANVNEGGFALRTDVLTPSMVLVNRREIEKVDLIFDTKICHEEIQVFTNYNAADTFSIAFLPIYVEDPSTLELLHSYKDRECIELVVDVPPLERQRRRDVPLRRRLPGGPLVGALARALGLDEEEVGIIAERDCLPHPLPVVSQY